MSRTVEQQATLARDRLTPETAGLQPSDLDRPGYVRRRCGKGWRFLDCDGASLSDEQRERCRSLAIPPAWTDVWIAPRADHHIQACGTDEGGRRQYLYHPDWRRASDSAKFSDLARFAERLPRLRARLHDCLASSRDPEELALACIVSLIDAGGLRIGSPRHWRKTGAMGAVTLRRHNVAFDGSGIHLHFIGKGGKEHHVDIADPELRDGLARLARANGEALFQSEDHAVTAQRVNRFIEARMGLGFTAKDFRTWGGSVAAIHALRRTDNPTISAASDAAAQWLGNTPAIARSSYIHPAIIELAREGAPVPPPSGPTRLRLDERCCYAVIT